MRIKQAVLPLIVSALLGLGLAGMSTGASAVTIGFDDLTADETQPIADGYQGLNWSNIATINGAAYPGSGYEAGTVSPANAAYNMDGGTAAIWSATSFNFLGAYFTSAWFDQELAFDGYLNGALVYTTAVSTVISTTTPQWVSLGWNGIDTLVIYNSSGTQWAMDDVSIPEPASMGLIGASLAGLLIARRRKSAAL